MRDDTITNKALFTIAMQICYESSVVIKAETLSLTLLLFLFGLLTTTVRFQKNFLFKKITYFYTYIITTL